MTFTKLETIPLSFLIKVQIISITLIVKYLYNILLY